jgi:rhodanese-related sulfurtransferase
MTKPIRPVQELIDRVRATVPALTPAEARRRLGDPGTVFVDLRDSAEIAAEGTVPGAIHMPRGNLEFWIDPASPYFKRIFGTGKSFVFFCAADLRSTLAAATARDMGLEKVSHIAGGFHAWRDAGGPVASSARTAAEASVDAVQASISTIQRDSA